MLFREEDSFQKVILASPTHSPCSHSTRPLRSDPPAGRGTLLRVPCTRRKRTCFTSPLPELKFKTARASTHGRWAFPSTSPRPTPPLAWRVPTCVRLVWAHASFLFLVVVPTLFGMWPRLVCMVASSSRLALPRVSTRNAPWKGMERCLLQTHPTPQGQGPPPVHPDRLPCAYKRLPTGVALWPHVRRWGSVGGARLAGMCLAHPKKISLSTSIHLLWETRAHPSPHTLHTYPRPQCTLLLSAAPHVPDQAARHDGSGAQVRGGDLARKCTYTCMALPVSSLPF